MLKQTYAAARAAALASLVAVALQAQHVAPDPAALEQIRDEGLSRSQVMDTASWLTDVHGSGLTNSPGMDAAADWTVSRLRGWGIEDAWKESWGPFGRGWSNERFVARVVSPSPWPLLAFPRAWTPGVGPVEADVVLAVIERDEDFTQWTGKLAGKVVLAQQPRAVAAFFDPPGRRRSDTELAELETQPAPPRGGGNAGPAGPGPGFAQRRLRFFQREGVAAVFEPGSGVGDHGSVHVTGSSALRHVDAEAVPPHLMLATEHYGRLARMLERNVPVRVHLDVENRFHDGSLDTDNIVADIPGTDRKDELVILGAHFDAWHAGTGATDNTAGCAVMMEAMRILKATGLPLRRTVRLALWTGEEQGLLGSRAYVAEHFADRQTMALKPAHEKLSLYLNLDNGTGVIRGVYLQGNEAARPVFAEWLRPFASTGAGTLTLRGTGGTDHLSFDDVGLPGFQFIQDPIEYFTHSHHASMDLYERLQPEDLKRNAVIVAWLAYQAANADERLPRKPLPTPRTPGAAQ